MEYNLKDSLERINEAVAAKDKTYEETDHIPPRNTLTFINGFYVKCSVVKVEFRGLSETDQYNNALLSKLYRTYVSEVTAVMNGCPKCAEINLQANGVSGFFDTPLSEDVDEVFSLLGKISSIVDIMNYKFKKLGVDGVTIGIGVAYGRALLMRTGYRGSGLGEVVWTGDVVKEASALASWGNRELSDREIMVSEVFYYNLKEDNQKLLALNSVRGCYHGDVVNSFMNNWYKQNCR